MPDRITYIEANVTVDHSELPGSPKERESDNGSFTATRRLLCAWADRGTLARQLLGGAISASGSNVADNVIQLPQIYPHKDSNSVRARFVDTEPFFPEEITAGSSTQLSSYTDAVLTVEYAPNGDQGELSDDDSVDVLAEEDVASWTEYIQGPQIQLAWAANKLATDSAPLTKMVKGLDWIYTRKRMASVGQAFWDLLGHVNDSAIKSQSLGITFPPETLLYDGIGLGRTIRSDGVSQWETKLTFKSRGGGDGATWNHFWDFAANAWKPLYLALVDSNGGVTTGDRVKPYTAGALSRLVF